MKSGFALFPPKARESGGKTQSKKRSGLDRRCDASEAAAEWRDPSSAPSSPPPAPDSIGTTKNTLRDLLSPRWTERVVDPRLQPLWCLPFFVRRRRPHAPLPLFGVFSGSWRGHFSRLEIFVGYLPSFRFLILVDIVSAGVILNVILRPFILNSPMNSLGEKVGFHWDQSANRTVTVARVSLQKIMCD